MRPCIDNAIDVAKWIAQCARADQFSEGNDGEACRVRDLVSKTYIGTKVTHLGAGYYSAVFTLPEYFDDVVIKVCLDRKEVSYIYLAECMQNPGPHLPTVHYVERMWTPGGKPIGFVAVLKKMRPLSSEEKQDFYGLLGERVRSEVKAPSADEPFSTLHAVAHALYNRYADLVGWDLHADNVMKDENGTIIITDPITVPHKSGVDRDGKPSARLTGMIRSLGLPEAA